MQWLLKPDKTGLRCVVMKFQRGNKITAGRKSREEQSEKKNVCLNVWKLYNIVISNI